MRPSPRGVAGECRPVRRRYMRCRTWHRQSDVGSSDRPAGHSALILGPSTRTAGRVIGPARRSSATGASSRAIRPARRSSRTPSVGPFDRPAGLQGLLRSGHHTGPQVWTDMFQSGHQTGPQVLSRPSSGTVGPFDRPAGLHPVTSPWSVSSWTRVNRVKRWTMIVSSGQTSQGTSRGVTSVRRCRMDAAAALGGRGSAYSPSQAKTAQWPFNPSVSQYCAACANVSNAVRKIPPHRQPRRRLRRSADLVHHPGVADRRRAPAVVVVLIPPPPPCTR